MDEVIQKLENAIEIAMGACAKSLPNKDMPPEYQWGRLQGRYAGLTDALRIVLDCQESEENFDVGDQE